MSKINIHDSNTSQKALLYLIHYILPLCSLTLLIIGCAPVNPDPFTKYKTAVDEAQSDFYDVMSVNYDWTRAAYSENFSGQITELMEPVRKEVMEPVKKEDMEPVKKDCSPPDVPLQPPLYLCIKQARISLSELNGAFSEYTDLLVKLASGDLVTASTFDQFNKDINKSATDAIKALKAPVSTEGTAGIISSAASDMIHLYIEKRRKEYLWEAILKNQSNVQNYSEVCKFVIDVISGNMLYNYNRRITAISNAPKPNDPDQLHKQTEAVLNLNDEYNDSLSILGELNEFYKILPNAHAELAKVIEKPYSDLNYIRMLYSKAMRLKVLNNELTKGKSVKEAESEGKSGSTKANTKK